MKIKYGSISFLFVISFWCCRAVAGEQGKKPLLTFLDTINKGREVSITAADVAPQQASSPSDTVASAAAVAGPEREAGVVPSRFKIQVLASKQEQMVKKEKSTLSAKVSLPLVIIFEAPYYKLFAGDFARHDDAESACAQLKKMGYNDAWIVRTAALKQ